MYKQSSRPGVERACAVLTTFLQSGLFEVIQSHTCRLRSANLEHITRTSWKNPQQYGGRLQIDAVLVSFAERRRVSLCRAL